MRFICTRRLSWPALSAVIIVIGVLFASQIQLRVTLFSRGDCPRCLQIFSVSDAADFYVSLAPFRLGVLPSGRLHKILDHASYKALQDMPRLTDMDVRYNPSDVDYLTIATWSRGDCHIVERFADGGHCDAVMRILMGACDISLLTPSAF